MPDSFPVLDTHTGGEITRVMLASDLGLQGNSPTEHLAQLKNDKDWIRQSLTSEPRGSEYAVGAIVSPPVGNDHGSIVFFNNVDYLGMCGHGLIGVVEALRHWGLVKSNTLHFQTPPGSVTATLCNDHSVQFEGVQSYCYRQDVSIVCDDGVTVTGDIAYGGNWFFLAETPSVSFDELDSLLQRTKQIRKALDSLSITGSNDALIDHVELFSPLETSADDLSRSHTTNGARTFVLCPGGHYDRSPCGTGTSAKLACLAARGQLAPGDHWVQESITGSRFIASFRHNEKGVRVSVQGKAHVIAETTQVFDSNDPLKFGFGGVKQ